MRWVQVVAAALLALAASAAGAQGWPQKPVRFIVPFPPGGATDISARLLGEKLSQIWGQQVVIENRGGAGGGVGAAEAARAAPDGYTLLFPSGSVVTANQHIYANVVSGPQVVAVPAGSPHKTVTELIEALKASPGKLTFGHAGIGSQTHLAAENLLSAAKLDAVAVPYKGEGPALAGLVSGEIVFAVTNLAATLPHVNSGRVRALGVTSKTEAPQLPGVPPVAKTLPGFENAGWFGIVAPTGTKKALEASDLKARLYVQGLAPVGNTPEEMGKAMKEETALWARVVRERNIKVQ
jgi:tripartite-type tricarboxylate transporter receptor subunit TctC